VQHVGADPVPPQAVGDLLPEEGDEGGDAPLLGDLGDAAGGVDAEHGDAGLDVVAEEVAVVARHLDRQAVGPRCRSASTRFTISAALSATASAYDEKYR
jgi:hypothetical protein